jgi:anion-transporting  ArsA/GET3 family ATPase
MDAQATGHAISMLSLPQTIAEAAPPGILKTKAAEILSLVTSQTSASLCVVTTPEEMPVNEAAELCRVNRARIGMPQGWLFINRVIEPVFGPGELDGITGKTDLRLASAVLCARFRTALAGNQKQYLEKARADVPLPSVAIPEYFRGSLGLPETHAAARTIMGAFGDE